MPPRFTYWTIIAGGLPTAFRAAERDEIMPTFQRLREKHPDAALKWFARGKLWDSPEEARAAREQERRPTDRRGDRRSRFEGRGPRTPDGGAGPREERRDRDWRPGGDHRDPRKKFADAKKARNAARRQQRFDRKHNVAKPQGGDERERFGQKPHSHESGRREERRPSSLRERPRGNKPFQPKSADFGGQGARGRQGPGARPFQPKPPDVAGQGARGRQGPGARPFERPGFERKRESTSGRGPRHHSKLDPPAPRGDDESRPRRDHDDRQRRGRFRRS